MINDLLVFFANPAHVLLVIANIPLYYLYYKLIFGNTQNLGDSFRQSSQLDIVAFCRGSLLDDWWHTAKIICWAFLCYKTVNLEYFHFFK
jgi:uncharacterized membrane-anchored protein YitT (DUF2179 family)